VATLLENVETWRRYYPQIVSVAIPDADLWLVIAIIMFVQNKHLGVAEEAIRHAFSLAPEELSIIHILAGILVRRGKWFDAVQYMRRYVTEGSPEAQEARLPSAIGLFREAVRAGRARDAIGLLEETGLGERWRPLREALHAAAEGPDVLLAIAPEVRAPAEQILRQLTAEEPMQEEGQLTEAGM
jgi:hypothetical protein